MEEERSITLQAHGQVEGLHMQYEGVWHETYPAKLITAPHLTDSARIQYLYLMQWMRTYRQQSEAVEMPTLEQCGVALNHSRATLVRDRLILRLTGWLHLVKTVRDARGRVRGQIYALHADPIDLEQRLVRAPASSGKDSPNPNPGTRVQVLNSVRIH